ncbi:MAG: cyclic nucleotide-binding domain-containing protein [Deltaproteobacteria bacterium]|nr:cyclic nucleotide-binding domain-containing protein [Deltaproteobacteria bacterium]
MWREKDITRVYRKGEVIINEGDAGREMFIIKSGSVEVIKKKGNKKIILATLERGDFFGEMALLENLPRTATVIAREVTHLLVLNIGSFLIKLKRDPTFAFNLMQKMSKRIRILNKKILKLSNMDKGDFSGIEFTIEKSEFLKAKDF